MKKTLVIVSHPNIVISRVNKRWIQELEKNKDEFTVHHLEENYPDKRIDFEREQSLLESHDNLILQFPIFRFTCPTLMKKWIDDVLTRGWPFGFENNKITNRKIALAVTAGIDEEEYSQNGKFHYTLGEMLIPFEVVFNFINADYKGFTAFYGAQNNSSDKILEKSAADYIDFLRSI